MGKTQGLIGQVLKKLFLTIRFLKHVFGWNKNICPVFDFFYFCIAVTIWTPFKPAEDAII